MSISRLSVSPDDANISVVGTYLYRDYDDLGKMTLSAGYFGLW
ncbi:hypothetical protein ACUSRQ_003745 [Vibrio harveyi]